jgi:riboflavin kinase/FMN adenylyltransferase
MGFPTANIHPSNPDKLLPACGVYAIHAEVGAQRYGGVLNIGHRPTLNNGNNLSIEAHLFDFEGNLYGKTLTVSLVARLRDELRFESREDLQQQIHADVSMAKRILAAQ